jgi:uncharacterized protein (DUF1684 family)
MTMTGRFGCIFTSLVFNLATTALPASAVAGDYQSEIEQWRHQREAKLKANDGWLTVAGLFWLRPGEARLGSDPSSDVLLPAHAPGTVGTMTLDSTNHAEFQPAGGVSVTCKGQSFRGGPLRSDAEAGGPDVLAIGDLKLILIKRGERLAIRLKDNQSEARQSFAGLRWFPVEESWRIKARFLPHASPVSITFDTVVGERDVMESPGDIEFTRDGKTYRLRAVKEGDELWFVFRDATSGRTTHGGARQLYSEMPHDGVVVLDFNKAMNLPCAYTPYATCPLAPRQNRLPLAVMAGEMKYAAGH